MPPPPPPPPPLPLWTVSTSGKLKEIISNCFENFKILKAAIYEN
jgi:hypothetical protein